MTFSAKAFALINEKLPESYVDIMNLSHQHAVPLGSESHFQVVVVSAVFRSLSLLKRHRLVQEVLAPLISQVKAINLHTLTPEEWESRKAEGFDMPQCAGKKSS